MIILTSYEKVNRYDIKRNSEKNIQVKIIKSMVLEVEGQRRDKREMKLKYHVILSISFYRFFDNSSLLKHPQTREL